MTESVIHALISAAGVIPAHSSPKPSSYMANQLCVLAGGARPKDPASSSKAPAFRIEITNDEKFVIFIIANNGAVVRCKVAKRQTTNDDNAPLDNCNWRGVRAMECRATKAKVADNLPHICVAGGYQGIQGIRGNPGAHLWVNRSPIVRQLIFHSNENAPRTEDFGFRSHNEHGQGFVWYKKVFAFLLFLKK